MGLLKVDVHGLTWKAGAKAIEDTGSSNNLLRNSVNYLKKRGMLVNE